MRFNAYSGNTNDNHHLPRENSLSVREVGINIAVYPSIVLSVSKRLKKKEKYPRYYLDIRDFSN